ncbi:MAG: UDP-3-O-(3-hydroxymyristoyl)glucosamine N-acyltransferase [Chitinophagaceae bacterium]|nr:UDP-3-O-(3-hydroxymyristoyl)glucosamine N-acyltransferase [Chitinophagaceae bacterium]
MRFSHLLDLLRARGCGPDDGETERFLAEDPVLTGAAALDQATASQLSFLEPGHALAGAAGATDAGAVLVPARGDEAVALQSLLRQRGVAWAALADPRLAFAEALELLHPPRQRPPGIHPSAVIDPSAQLGSGVHVGAQVVIGAGVRLGDGCVLHPRVVLDDDVALGAGCELHAGAVLQAGSQLGEGCVVQANAVIGGEGFGFVPTAAGWRKMPQTGRVVLEDGVEVGSGSCIDRPAVGETRIGAGTKIDNLVHIGHGVTTGRGCALAAQVGIAGGARLGNGVILAGQVGLANRAVMGDRAIASSKSGVHGEVAAGEVVSGYPAIPNRLWLRCAAAFNRLPELARSLRQLEKRSHD